MTERNAPSALVPPRPSNRPGGSRCCEPVRDYGQAMRKDLARRRPVFVAPTREQLPPPCCP
jgi:hypothetical protein